MKRIGLAIVMTIMVLTAAAHAADKELNTAYFRDIDDMYIQRPGKGGYSCTVGVTGLRAAVSTSKGVVVELTEPGTPAHGKFKKGDVILGINGVPLKDLNVYVVLGKMLTRAEETDGRMVFDVKPAGATTTSKVEVKIPVLGSYSDTWPVNCPKSKKIIDRAARYIAGNLEKFDGEGTVLKRAQACLFLLSTGDDTYLPRVKAFLAPFIKDPKAIGSHTWNNGYNGILFGEYYLRTGDKSVMPVIQYYCDNARDRQYLGGWNHWGHGINPRYMDGGLMNAAGANVFTSLLLAKECGANVDKGTLLRALTFYYRFVGKGAVPYGAHRPEGVLANNGKDGMAAAAMQIASGAQGDVSNYRKARDFLAMSTLASYPRLAKGHGDGGRGDTWWRGLASSYVRDRDPKAYQKAMDDIRWFYDLSRLPSGRFRPAMVGGERGTNSGGMLALTYTAPLKTLRITGAPRSKFARDFTLPVRPWGTKADEAFLEITNHKDFADHGTEEPMHVTQARIGTAYRKPDPSFAPTKEQLIRDMHHRYSVVRCQAAKALRKMGALKELEQFLSAKDPRLRRAALDGLLDYSYRGNQGKNTIGPAQYTDAMIKAIVGMLKNPDEAWWVIDGALLAMTNMPAEVIQQNMELILPWTTHDDWWLRESSFLALSGLKTDKALYRKVLPKLFAMLQAEENEMSYIYTLKGHFAEQLRSKKLDPELRTLITEGLNGSARDKPVREGWRGAIDGYNTAMLITDILNRAPGTAPALAKSVLKRVENIPNPQLVRLLATPNSFTRWTGFYTVLDKLPAKERKALEDTLYTGFLPELCRRLAAMEGNRPNTDVLNAALDLRGLRGPSPWQCVGNPLPAKRTWRYLTFGPLRKKDEQQYLKSGKSQFRPIGMIQLPDNLDKKKWQGRHFKDSSWAQGKTPIGKGVFMEGGRPYRGKVHENASKWGDGEFILMRYTFDLDEHYYCYSLNILSAEGCEVYINGRRCRLGDGCEKTPEYRRVLLTSHRHEIGTLKKGRNVLAVYTHTKHLQNGKQFGQIDVVLEGLRKRDLGMKTGQPSTRTETMAKKPDYEVAVERQTPEQWQQLTRGGQFMDRILPAPIHDTLTSDTWGADGVRPRDMHNGIEDPEWSYWGGKPVLGPDGRYHWFGCRWPEDNPKGHGGWPGSEIVRAIGDSPMGPFVFENRIGPGHFPEITQLRDGSWRLYHFEGYYASDSLDGPWTHVTKKADGFPDIQMGSVCDREDGSLLMIGRACFMYVKEHGADVWEKKTEKKVFPTHMEGLYEDPVIWRTEVQYHMLINDWQGRIAYHQRSEDGIHWVCDPGRAYTVGIDRYEDGTSVDWFKYERPKVFQDKYGRPTHLYLAVIDAPKWQDEGGDNHSSKNIVLPLVVERRLQVLNDDPITAATEEIRVKVFAEPGFDPHADMDLDSLRFGAPQEVDYGRGSVLTGSQAEGPDRILVFDGNGHGITADEFAGKLLGKTATGDLLLGWARLSSPRKGRMGKQKKR